MATLVLSAVGTAIGGPIGGALGALLGQSVDRNLLFKPKGREGPRLSDLAVQLSTYGKQIPRIYGTMRVSGSVIWATDLKESKKKSGGGKGRPSNTVFSYSVSLAVALSSRPIKEVRRIWADGKLLRGASGDLKVQAKMRLYNGYGDQPADPLIAAAEGVAVTPAHRGTAYIIFEDLHLADYGNHIPSMTFEVVADAGDISIVEIADDLSGGLIGGTIEQSIVGFSAAGDSVRGVLETMSATIALAAAGTGERLILKDLGNASDNSSVTEINDPVAELNNKTKAILEYVKKTAATIPHSLAVRYYEPEREYQTGLQRAFNIGVLDKKTVRRNDVIEFPAALSASKAKALIEMKVLSQYFGRDKIEVTTSWSQADIGPGTLVSIKHATGRNFSGLWRVENWELEQGAIRLSLARHNRMSSSGVSQADPGRSVSDTDQAIGVTRLLLMDLPSLDGKLAQHAQVFVAAAGTESGWRSAALSISQLGDSVVDEMGVTAAAAIMGSSTTELAANQGPLFDEHNKVIVRLLHKDMELEDADYVQLRAGRNLAMIGTEVLQFGRAKPLGDNLYELSQFVRSIGGTEASALTHQIGDDFILLDPTALRQIDRRYSETGQSISVLGQGVADVLATRKDITVCGRALNPWSPVHGRSEHQANGSVMCSWVRRTRSGGLWQDKRDVELGEDEEAYRVILTPAPSGIAKSVVVKKTEHIIPASDIANFLSNGAIKLNVAIVQMGTAGDSAPLEFSTNL